MNEIIRFNPLNPRRPRSNPIGQKEVENGGRIGFDLLYKLCRIKIAV